MGESLVLYKIAADRDVLREIFGPRGVEKIGTKLERTVELRSSWLLAVGVGVDTRDVSVLSSGAYENVGI